jgi:Rrf2 family iron-sulfur cluster assembly transcriptional regulator
MQIANRAFFGVETLVRLAESDAATPCTTDELAHAVNRSTSYMEGLMSRLRDAGFVTSRKGPGGGYYLSRPAARITVAYIFQAFDEPRWGEYVRPRMRSLPQSTVDELLNTDLLWENLKSRILLFLDGVSLAELVPQPDGEQSVAGTDHSSWIQRDTVPVSRH